MAAVRKLYLAAVEWDWFVKYIYPFKCASNTRKLSVVINTSSIVKFYSKRKVITGWLLPQAIWENLRCPEGSAEMPDIRIERKDLPDDLLWVDGSKILTMFGIYLDGYPPTMEWRLEAVSHELCFSWAGKGYTTRSSVLFVERYRCMKNNIEGSGTVCKQCLVLTERGEGWVLGSFDYCLVGARDRHVCVMDSTAAQTAEIGWECGWTLKLPYVTCV